MICCKVCFSIATRKRYAINSLAILIPKTGMSFAVYKYCVLANSMPSQGMPFAVAIIVPISGMAYADSIPAIIIPYSGMRFAMPPPRIASF